MPVLLVVTSVVLAMLALRRRTRFHTKVRVSAAETRPESDRGVLHLEGTAAWPEGFVLTVKPAEGHSNFGDSIGRGFFDIKCDGQPPKGFFSISVGMGEDAEHATYFWNDVHNFEERAVCQVKGREPWNFWAVSPSRKFVVSVSLEACNPPDAQGITRSLFSLSLSSGGSTVGGSTVDRPPRQAQSLVDGDRHGLRQFGRCRAW